MTAGDKYVWRGGGGLLFVQVTRVARDGSWADIKVHSPGGRESWAKRQPLGRIVLEPFDWTVADVVTAADVVGTS